MSAHLTPGQRALLKTALELRRSELERRLAAQLQGQSRAEHARDVLLQDGDDAPQRGNDREVDLALTDLETQELGAVSLALKRLAAAPAGAQSGEGFGLCTDCGAEIPFDRLKIEPWALRCVACESGHERAQRRAG